MKHELTDVERKSKSRDWMLDIGTRVRIVNQGSVYFDTLGTISGYDPTMFWHYAVEHDDGKEWWWLRTHVEEVP